MHQKNFSMVITCLLVTGFIFAGLIFTGCESVVPVELPEHAPQLSATSFFNPDSSWQVYVSNTVPYSASLPPSPIQDARVLIMTGNQVVDSLVPHPFIGEGFYLSSTGHKPEPQRRYTIRIQAAGFEDIEGEDTIPLQVPLNSWTINQTINGSGIPQLNLSLTFNDPAETRNFYGISVLAYIEDLSDDSLTFRYSYPAAFTTQDPAITGTILIGATEETSSNATFNDDLFSGQSYTLDLEIEIPFLLDRADESTGNLSHVICLQSISEDLYRYWQTAELQEVSLGDYFAEPVQVHSNLSSKVGVFGGYQQHCQTVSEITF